jgi:glycosyltransferase involved in cell wall biosynthesis
MRVLVGCPTYEGYGYCLDEYAAAVKMLTFKDIDVVLVDNSQGDDYADKIKTFGVKVLRSPHMNDVRERIVVARNKLRDYFLQGDYEYFLSLEQDVIPPPDVLERLMRHKQLVVSGVYYKEFVTTYTHQGKALKTVKKIFPLVYTSSPGFEASGKMHMCSVKDVDGDKFFKIRGAGLGCLLIHRRVVEKIIFHGGDDAGTYDDICLSNDLYDLKIPMYVDTSVKCKHMLSQKKR